MVRGSARGALLTLPFIALLYVGEQAAGLPFVPFDLFDWLARVLPGGILRLGIAAIVATVQRLGLGPISPAAKLLEQLIGVVLVVLAGALTGAVLGAIAPRARRPGWQVGALAGVALWVPLVALEAGGRTAGQAIGAAVWLALLLVAWGSSLGDALSPRPTPSAAPALPATSRRRALLALAAGAAVFAWGVGRLLHRNRVSAGAGQPLPGTPLAPGGAETARAALDPAPGTRPPITPNASFYRIDINTRPPVVDGERWRLAAKGLFERPRSLTLRDLMAYTPTTATITQACISNPIGGDLIGTTRYTGVVLRVLLGDLGLRPSARALVVRSVDGLYEAVSMEDMLDARTLLVYGMNGTTLPTEHGFPLRIYIPNRYGMKQPKWIQEIEAVGEEAGHGYWEDRGWSRQARPRIISIIDHAATDHVEGGRVPVGGIAWAGDRGIRRVEIQVDAGPWTEARLLLPDLGQLAWVLWRYDWPARPGRHTVRVRAVDGTGALQIAEPADVYPAGATGYHRVSVNVRA